jgi:hypothetical protein
MDPVAVMLVLTFIVMLATAAMTMPFQPPPVLRRQVACPEDHEEATVAFSWDITRRRIAIVECDHRENGHCQDTCATRLQTAWAEPHPSVVLP